MKNNLKARVVSPKFFPLDPRYEQTRTPLKSLRPGDRSTGHHSRESSLLLSLPDEILWLIVELIAEENQGRFLSQFALVHRQCWQLARPYQFADVWLTRSELSSDFLRHLENEVDSGREPLIGSCIRSLTITVDKDFGADFAYKTPAQDGSYVEDWTDKWEMFIERIGIVVRTSLPNLRQVYWMDTAELDPQHLLPAVLERATPPGRLETLYLEDWGYEADFGEVDFLLQPFNCNQSFCLRDLAFGFSRSPPGYGDPDGATMFLYEALLRRSASTLESFVWSSQVRGAPITEDGYGGPTMVMFRDGFIPFERLNKFWAFSKDEIDLTFIEPFLAAPLQSFGPSRQICSVMLANSLPEKYPLPHLRTYAVTGRATEIMFRDRVEYIDEVMKLGRQYGPQLDELFVYLRKEPFFGESGVDVFLPHFASGSFSNLRSLCFSWDTDDDLKILQVVGSNLLALEELSFGFGPKSDQTGSFTPPRPDYEL